MKINRGGQVATAEIGRDGEDEGREGSRKNRGRRCDEACPGAAKKKKKI